MTTDRRNASIPSSWLAGIALAFGGGMAIGPTTLAGGSISFANLAIGDSPDPSKRSDLEGTINWTCGPVVGVPN